MRTELQAIEREVSSVLQGLPIYEPLFQLMCHGVPSPVKAAVNRAIAALGRFKDAAGRLLDRLLAAAVVATQSTMDGYAGEHQHYLSIFDAGVRHILHREPPSRAAVAIQSLMDGCAVWLSTSCQICAYTDVPQIDTTSITF